MMAGGCRGLGGSKIGSTRARSSFSGFPLRKTHFAGSGSDFRPPKSTLTPLASDYAHIQPAPGRTQVKLENDDDAYKCSTQASAA
jgi:hypothetical protein